MPMYDDLILIALDYYLSVIGFRIDDKTRKCHGYVTVIKEELENFDQ
jgi:hypothetical protein